MPADCHTAIGPRAVPVVVPFPDGLTLPCASRFLAGRGFLSHASALGLVAALVVFNGGGIEWKPLFSLRFVRLRVCAG